MYGRTQGTSARLSAHPRTRTQSGSSGNSVNNTGAGGDNRSPLGWRQLPDASTQRGGRGGRTCRPSLLPSPLLFMPWTDNWWRRTRQNSDASCWPYLHPPRTQPRCGQPSPQRSLCPVVAAHPTPQGTPHAPRRGTQRTHAHTCTHPLNGGGRLFRSTTGSTLVRSDKDSKPKRRRM